MRSELLLILSVVLALNVGCDPETPPPPPTDAGPRDARVRVDAGPGDAGQDAGTPDGGMDSGTDASVPDAGSDAGQDAGRDAGPDALVVTLDGSLPDIDGAPEDGGFTPGPDSGPCTFPDGGFNLCGCPDGLACVDDSVCPTNQACTIDPGCGPDRCSLRGHRCGMDTDCPSGSTCERGGFVAVCIPSGATCNDLRDCPTGYSCDSGACVARRVPCDDLLDCPFGYFCSDETPGTPYCIRLPRRCATDDACEAGFTCQDIDGDSLGECVGVSGSCTNATCPDDEVCGTDPNGVRICAATGLCRSADDCASTHACLDLAGDGITECVQTGGSCTGPTDCPSGAICAVEAPDSPPRCIDAPLP